MLTRLIRAAVLALVTLASLMAGPAFAVNKTVNGITVNVDLPQIARGIPYSHQIAPTGPTGYSGSYSFSQIAGALPPGITLSSTGLVSGTTCSANGSYSGQGFRISTNQTPATVSDFTAGNAFSVNVTTSPNQNCSLVVSVTPAPPNGTVGNAYSHTFTTTGGTAPYSYSLSSGSLPTGLVLSGAGVLSGTPSAAGTYTFTITSVDSSATQKNGVATYTVTIAPSSGVTLTVNPTTLPNGATAAAYSQTISASGGTAPYTYAITAGGLPAGLSLSTGGALTGTPTAAGTYTFTVGATDNVGNVGQRAYSLVVSPGNILTINPSTLAGGTNGTAYSQTVTATGGTGPYTFAVTAGSLPTGLSLATGGALTGTPSTAGTYTFTVTGTDANGDFGTRAYSVAIVGAQTLTVGPTTLPAGTNGSGYNQTLTASGGSAPYTWSVSSGSLPQGVTLSAGGVLTGTPTVAGTYTFTVYVVDANGNFGSRSYTLTVAGAQTLTINPTTLPGGTNGTAYSQTISATGGTSPYTFAVTAGSLPTGLSLATGGALTGTPSVAGTYTFTIRGADANGDFGTRAYSVTIAGAQTLSIGPATLPGGANGSGYNQTLTASGGTGPYTFSIDSGALPPGVTLSASGQLTGTPTGAGSYGFTVRVVDANGNFQTITYTLVIAGAQTLTINPATLPGGTNGTAYSQTISATGGTAPYTFAITAGTLPTGLSLAAGGALTGTPTVAGTYSFDVTGTDANGDFGVRSYSVTIAGANTLSISPATLPAATNGTAYNQALSGSGGTAPYGFTVSAGSLPAGISLSPTGALTGTPSVAGTYTFTVQVVDANGNFGTRGYTFTVNGAQSLTVTPSSLPDATYAVSYTQAIGATGGTGPYTFAVTSGSLPFGVALTASGSLTGTPTGAPGTATFTVTATDANGDFGTRAYTLLVNGVVLALSPATLPNGTNGTAYSQSITAANGISPYEFAVTSGSLPTGLSLSINGALTGTPTVAGSYTFEITATDDGDYTGSRQYTVAIAGAQSLVINPATLPAGAYASAYSQAITASGGTAPYSFVLTSGSLPAGLALASNGTLSGTPAAAGTYSFDVTGSDANGDFGVRSYSLVIAAPTITVAPATLPAGTNGTAYTQTITASGGMGPYGYAVTAGALPTGLVLSAGGALTGAPTVAGSYGFTITATDANGFTGTRAYTVAVAGASNLVVNPASLPSATNRTAYSQTLTATGGTAPYSFQVTAGSLPTGLALAPSGALTGTPTVAGSYTFTVEAVDANGNFGSRSYTVTVAGANALAISPATLPAGTNGSAYSQTLTASNGTAPYTFAVTSGALPTGLSLAAGGALSGTPTVAGTYAFTVTATDVNGDFGTRAYSVTIAGAQTLTVNPATLPNGTNGTAYSQTITATGGTAPYTFALTAGTLPTGLSLATGGALSGTPTVAGSYGFTVTGTDANGNFGVRSYTLVVAGAQTLTVNPATLAPGTNGTPYSQTFTATGGTAPYTFAVTSGTLPTGLSLSAAGALTGTPTAAGVYGFVVRGTDANGNFGTRSYTLTVAGAGTLVINPATLPNGTNGTAYSQTITATGGTAPYTFAVTAGTLPGGMTLSTGGLLSGTPTAAGSYGFTVTGTDANGNFGTRAYTVVIAGAGTLAINPATLPGGTNGATYSQTITASGGTAPYAFAVTAGTLPPGLTLAAGGALTGTPGVAGTYAFTVQGTDANGNFGTRAYSVTIAGAGTLAINPATLPAGTNGTPYTQTLTATGGTAPYTFAVTGGALPGGMTLTSGGLLSGTPTLAGTYTFTVTGTDANGNFGTRSYTLVVAGAGTLTINPATLPAGTNGTAYSQALTATGGTAPYTFAVTSGTLPTGLALTAGGALSGTPTVAGTYTFTVTGTDANGNFGTRSYSLVVAGAATLTINPATLPPGTNGTPYSQTFTATGGTAPYTFAVTAGTLPGGMTLTSGGLLSGTPSVAGTYTFTVTGTDANGNFGTRSYSLVVAGAATLTINPATLPTGTNGTLYSQTLTATGGTAPYTFAVTAGALPGGVALTSGGLLSGTPSVAGTYTFTVTGTDAKGNFGTRSYSLVVAGAQTLTVTPATLPNGNAQSPYSQQFAATGGTAPYTYTVATGSLPPGLTLTAGGLLSGTPSAPGTYTFTVRGQDANGNFGLRQVTLVIGLSIRPDPTVDPTVVGGVNEQLGAARRAGESQMSHVFRRLDGAGGCEAAASADGASGDCEHRVDVWATGTHESNISRSGGTSLGVLTFGADTRIGNGRVGVALGTGRDTADLDVGFRGDADSTAYMAYGQWSITPSFRLDAVAGRARLDMTSRRRVGNGVTADGQRDGDTEFAGVGLSGRFALGNAGLAPYVRYETMRLSLDGYTERSSSPLALQYGAMETRTRSVLAGAEAFYGFRFGWGLLTPKLRVEYRDRSGDAATQTLWYADRPQTLYSLRLPGVDSRAFSTSLGLEAAFNGLTVRMEYGTSGSALRSNEGQSLQLQVRGSF